MALFDFLESTDAQTRKSHLLNMFSVAFADGDLDIKEVDLINKIALRLEMTRKEVDEALSNPKSVKHQTPVNPEERHQQIYDLVNVMLVDGEINPKEYSLCRSIALKSGYKPAIVDDMLKDITRSARDGKSAQDHFLSYQKNLVD